MKKIISVLAIVLLISSVSFAIANYADKEGDKKTAKKECTKKAGDKSCCAKKTASLDGDKAEASNAKACCSKKTAKAECNKSNASAKKACCSKKTAKAQCDKAQDRATTAAKPVLNDAPANTVPVKRAVEIN